MEYQKTLNTNIPNRDSSQPSVVIKIPTPNIDPTSNWNTYANTEYGFEFKYPKSSETKIEKNSVGEDYLIIDKYTSFVIGNSSIRNCEGMCPTIDKVETIIFNNIHFEKITTTPPEDMSFKGRIPLEYFIETKLENSKIVYFSFGVADRTDINILNSTNKLITQILSTFKLLDKDNNGLGDEDTKKECLQKGGVWQKWGIDFSKEYCQIPATDAGKICTDGSECSYKICISRDEISKDGNCSRYRREFGCFSTLTNGVKEPVICYD